MQSVKKVALLNVTQFQPNVHYNDILDQFHRLNRESSEKCKIYSDLRSGSWKLWNSIIRQRQNPGDQSKLHVPSL